MKELTRVFSGISIPVEIIDDKNMYFNISGIANKFGKNITEWKNSRRVKELLSRLEKSNSLNLNFIDERLHGVTKIHNTLLINFARFISVDFEIASNEILMDILLGNKALHDKKELELLNTISLKENQLKISQNQTQEAVRKRYASSGDEYFCCVKKYINENELDISSEDFNTILLDEDVITQKKVDRYAPAPKSPHSAYDGTSIIVNIQKMNQVCKDRNIKTIEDDQMVFDFKTIQKD